MSIHLKKDTNYIMKQWTGRKEKIHSRPTDVFLLDNKIKKKTKTKYPDELLSRNGCEQKQ